MAMGASVSEIEQAVLKHGFERVQTSGPKRSNTDLVDAFGHVVADAAKAEGLSEGDRQANARLAVDFLQKRVESNGFDFDESIHYAFDFKRLRHLRVVK